jgi:hypothetical protein
VKKSEMIDLFENLVRSHALIDGSMSHIPQSQAREQVYLSRVMIEECVCTIRKELKK